MGPDKTEYTVIIYNDTASKVDTDSAKFDSRPYLTKK